MATVQLRRYEMVPGTMDAFLAWFPQVIPVRAQYGFTVLFAYADRERDEFIWAVSHDGDFEAAVAAYTDSPARAAVFKDQPERVANAHVSFVEVIAPG